MTNENLKQLEVLLKEIVSTPTGRRSFLVAAPFMLAACASHEKSRYREGDNSGQETVITVDDEKRMTKEVLPQFKKEYPALNNPEVQSYVESIGERLTRANQLENNPYQYTFTVCAAPLVNAFALPAGTVFVTAPLIAMAESEAELAGVIGHEIGHVKARHAAERMDKAKQESRRSLLYGLGGGLLGGAAGFGLGKLLCPPKDTECLARATAIGAAAGAGGGLLIQKFAFMANSQENEMEADRIGFRTAVVAGYSRDHVGDFYSKLQKMEEQHRKGQVEILQSVTDAMSTHPPSKERVAQMELMKTENAQLRQGEVSSKKFEKIRKMAEEWTASHPPKRRG